MINNRMDVQDVLSQMRQMRSQMQIQPQPMQNMNPAAMAQQLNQLSQGTALSDQPRGIAAVNDAGAVRNAPRFGEMFKSAIDTVNASQQEASRMRTAYELGVPGVDLPEVMIATNKASISFEATTQVRNKLLEAYKEIMNMPV